MVYRAEDNHPSRLSLTYVSDRRGAPERRRQGHSFRCRRHTRLAPSLVQPSSHWLGRQPRARERFYQLAAYPPDGEPGELELASGTDFAQRLFFRQPRSDLDRGTWVFDDLPHRVVMLDRLRSPPTIGHITGERRTSGDAINTLFDQLPRGDDSVHHPRDNTPGYP